MFAIQPYIAGAKALYDDIKRGVVEAGRPAAACKMLFGVQPIVGASRAEAEHKQAEHNALVPLEGGLAILSGHLDFDLSTLPLDTIMAHRTEPKLQRMQTRYRTATGELLTLRQVAQNHGQSVGLPQMVGTPADIADQLEAYFDQVGGDGFMLSPIYSPGAIEEFVDLVVPELQRRGRFRPGICGHHAARPSQPGAFDTGDGCRSGRNHPENARIGDALQHDIPSAQARKRRLSYGLTDVFVIAACSLTFAAVVGAEPARQAQGPADRA